MINLIKLIKEDLLTPKRNDPAFDSIFEIFFNYPGVWAIVNYRIANFLYRKNFKTLARIISGISTALTNVDIHPACSIGRRVFIDHAFGVVIGETAIIGNDVLIYQGVTLGGVSLSKGKRHPTIEDNCILGSGAKILGNITIGKNSKIGANSVVVKDVPPDSTAVGVPAKIVVRKDYSRLNHNILPDVSKEMFEYLIKRVAVLEDAIKKYDGIDVSSEEKELEEIYERFIKAIKDN